MDKDRSKPQIQYNNKHQNKNQNKYENKYQNKYENKYQNKYGNKYQNKQQNKKKNRFLKTSFRNFIIKIIVWCVGFPGVFLLLIEMIEVVQFQWLYDLSPSFYYNARRLFWYGLRDKSIYIIMPVIWVVGIIIMIYRMMKKYTSYINILSNSAGKLMDKNVEYIELPPELNEFQNQLNHIKLEAEKNERMAAESEKRKNDLIVYLAHDLKTPLTSMIGYLSLLDEISDMPQKQRERYIKIALEKSYKLEDLINELFDITRFNSETIVLEKEEMNLNMMLEQIIDDFYPILKECEKEIIYTPIENVIIYADTDKLYRVFNNLIKNSINYSTDRSIEIELEKLVNKVKITVSNKGKNISKEKLQRIFDKFYRADFARSSRTGGSGLGLAIAKEIVELHGGNITAQSEEGNIQFIVELPIKDGNHRFD